MLTVAEVAGTMAAKRTGELIPLCHPLPVDLIEVRAELEPGLPGCPGHGAGADARDGPAWKWKR